MLKNHFRTNPKARKLREVSVSSSKIFDSASKNLVNICMKNGARKSLPDYSMLVDGQVRQIETPR